MNKKETQEDNIFTSKKNDREEENVFTTKNTDDLTLHSYEAYGEKTKSKSFSFYSKDLIAINKLKDILKPYSVKKVTDTTVIKVGIHYLTELLERQDPKLIKELKRLINENN